MCIIKYDKSKQKQEIVQFNQLKANNVYDIFIVDSDVAGEYPIFKVDKDFTIETALKYSDVGTI